MSSSRISFLESKLTLFFRFYVVNSQRYYPEDTMVEEDQSQVRYQPLRLVVSCPFDSSEIFVKKILKFYEKIFLKNVSPFRHIWVLQEPKPDHGPSRRTTPPWIRSRSTWPTESSKNTLTRHFLCLLKVFEKFLLTETHTHTYGNRNQRISSFFTQLQKIAKLFPKKSTLL